MLEELARQKPQVHFYDLNGNLRILLRAPHFYIRTSRVPIWSNIQRLL